MLRMGGVGVVRVHGASVHSTSGTFTRFVGGARSCLGSLTGHGGSLFGSTGKLGLRGRMLGTLRRVTPSAPFEGWCVRLMSKDQFPSVITRGFFNIRMGSAVGGA